MSQFNSAIQPILQFKFSARSLTQQIFFEIVVTDLKMVRRRSGEHRPWAFNLKLSCDVVIIIIIYSMLQVSGYWVYGVRHVKEPR